MISTRVQRSTPTHPQYAVVIKRVSGVLGSPYHLLAGTVMFAQAPKPSIMPYTGCQSRTRCTMTDGQARPHCSAATVSRAQWRCRVVLTKGETVCDLDRWCSCARGAQRGTGKRIPRRLGRRGKVRRGAGCPFPSLAQEPAACEDEVSVKGNMRL